MIKSRFSVLLIVLVIFVTVSPTTAQEFSRITIENAAQLVSVTSLEGHEGAVFSVVFSPDGSLLASAGEDTTIRLWDMATNMEETTLTGLNSAVQNIAFSPDGATLVSLNQDWFEGDSTTRVWDIATGADMIVSDSGELRLALSPDGNVIAVNLCNGRVTFNFDPPPFTVFCSQNEIQLVNLHTGDAIQAFSDLGDKVWSMAFSPDGALLASGGEDGTLRIFDVNAGRELPLLLNLAYRVFGVRFSPDGYTLAGAIGDGSVRLIDVESRRSLRVLRGPTDTVAIDVAFSPDGTILASSHTDNTIRLWDVGTGDELITLQGHSDVPVSLAFSPDGTSLASGGYDGTVRLWNVPIDPTLDTDGDDILDGVDQCRFVAGDFNGCPDSDVDGVADNLDQCPDQVGMVESAGCLVGTVTSNANLREGPGTNSSIVGSASPGSSIALLGRNETSDWLRIRTMVEEGDPIEAWIFIQLITTEADVASLPIVP